MNIFQHSNQTAHTEYENWFRFGFEKDFEPISWTKWFQANWHHSITMSVLYLICIKFGEKFMNDRKAFELKSFMPVWNGSLAAFSLCGSLRLSEELCYVVRTFEFSKTICFSASPWGVTAVWATIFAFSKVLELGDTALIVLRKRKVIFLHWYHHVTVLVYTWHSGSEHTAAGRWFIFMNYTVHFFMYSYYTVRSLGMSVPKILSVSVTSMQISQMAMGIYISARVWQIKGWGQPCQQSYANLYLCFTIYFTYFLLFTKFFWDAYVAKSGFKRKIL